MGKEAINFFGSLVEDEAVLFKSMKISSILNTSRVVIWAELAIDFF